MNLFLDGNGRITCAALRCAGSTAYSSRMRRDLHGARIERMSAVDARDFMAITGKPPQCECCGEEFQPGAAVAQVRREGDAMTHTKGPWHANGIAKGRILGDEHAPGAEKIQIHATNTTVATVYRAADATLIKAAPTLAEALRALLAMMDAGITTHSMTSTRRGAYDNARAALSLAGLE